MKTQLGILTETDYLPFTEPLDLDTEELERLNKIKLIIKKGNLDELYSEFDFEESEVITNAEVDPEGQIHIYYVDTTELEDYEFDTDEEAMAEAKVYGLENFDIIYSQANACWVIKLK